MEIIIEIGTEEQKELIEKELEIIKTLSERFNPSPPLLCIIVPKDFDKKVNEIRGTNSYNSIREHHQAQAKIIETPKGIFLIISNLLYTEIHDNFTRLQLYLHEFMHVLNKERFVRLEEKSPSKSRYLENLYILFDEYYANRKAFDIIDSLSLQASPKYKRSNRTHLKYFIKPLINDSEHYDIIRNEIDKFRIHGLVDQFLKNTNSHFDEVSKAIVYSYSYIDHFPEFHRFKRFLLKSKFVNEKTINLINFYRKKFDGGSTDLSDGIELIAGFIENFGIRFEDCTEGLYCHVINI